MKFSVCCPVCGVPVEGKRLCSECEREVKEKLAEMAERYPQRFAMRLRMDVIEK